MAATLKYQRTLELEVVECPACFMEYGIPAEMYRQRRRETEEAATYCPNGHSWHFTGRSWDQKMKDAEARVLAARDQAAAAERQAAAARGQVTKLKNRIANGVCPCCHRSFANLARHMAGKHPGYQEEPA